jgi:hypothetical protein
MEQQPEHEGAREVVAPGPPWTWPGSPQSGVAIGEVFGDLAFWKSALGRESVAPLAASTRYPDDAADVGGPTTGVDGSAAGVDGSAPDLGATEAGVSASGADKAPAGSMLDWLEVAGRATEKALTEPVWRHTGDGLGAAMRLARARLA